MESNNVTLKRRIRESGLKQWQIADAIGMNEFVLSRKFRHPLPDELAEKIESAITKLTEGE